MALGPPPSRIFSSSLRIWATRSASARMLDSKRSEAGSTLVARTLLMARAVDSVRSGMGNGLLEFWETTYYTSGLAVRRAGKRCALQSSFRGTNAKQFHTSPDVLLHSAGHIHDLCVDAPVTVGMARGSDGCGGAAPGVYPFHGRCGQLLGGVVDQLGSISRSCQSDGLVGAVRPIAAVDGARAEDSSPDILCGNGFPSQQSGDRRCDHVRDLASPQDLRRFSAGVRWQPRGSTKFSAWTASDAGHRLLVRDYRCLLRTALGRFNSLRISSCFGPRGEKATGADPCAVPFADDCGSRSLPNLSSSRPETGVREVIPAQSAVACADYDSTDDGARRDTQRYAFPAPGGRFGGVVELGPVAC